MSQRIASAVLRSGRTSVGTWYVAPPTRRERTSISGDALFIAFLNISSPGWPVRSCAVSIASYIIRCAIDFFPPSISELINWETNVSPYFGSGVRGRFSACLFLICFYGYLVCKELIGSRRTYGAQK